MLKQASAWILVAAVIIAPAVLLSGQPATGARLASTVATERQSAGITIDYPEEGTIFPPEFPPPTVLWRDSAPANAIWTIEVKFANGSAGLKARSAGERMEIGEIDPRCVAKTNELPKLTEQQAAAHSWTPDAATWATLKKNSVNHPATITITGFSKTKPGHPVSRGVVTVTTSSDPVGAPIFYRDVPLMPADTQKGVIKPLVQEAIPLIAWRLRDVSQTKSRLMMQGLPTCANCHSVSADGKTMGMDVDGPQNDKGLYALVPVKAHTSIRNEDVITWKNVYVGKLGGRLRVGFMSQVSPDGRYVMTTINDPGVAQTETQRRNNPQDLVGNYFVTNFKDYRFGQVFYPTRGILAWYSRSVGRLRPLPGASDPRYVHTGATWSPDGKYLVFSRAEAREAYPPEAKTAEYANDPNETQIQYDLYRIPFNEGRGGEPERIVGASQNGMSNNFPKISPDGRWIVFVQCRNGQLMRPDSQLYIVPVEGGQARRMRCNTSLMNSWHSFSPDGRWLVFSSKARSPYTQMYLTHIDEKGQDSPAILIDNASAANRAVNIPEFVNVPPDSLVSMDAPATDFYRLFDVAATMVEKGEFQAAIPEFRKALELNPEDARSHNKLGIALAGAGQLDEAIAEYEKAFTLDPEYADPYTKLGLALARSGKLDEATARFEKALQLRPDDAEAHSNLAAVLIGRGQFDEAIAHCEKALASSPDDAGAHANLGLALLGKGDRNQAIVHLEKAAAAEPGAIDLQRQLARLLAETGRFDEAIPHLEKAVAGVPDSPELHYNLARLLEARGRHEEAIPHLQTVLRLAPGFTQAHNDLGAALYAVPGRIPEALAEWQQLLQAQPNNVPALTRIARVLATCQEASVRNGAEAVSLAERAVQLSGGQEPNALDTLGTAYAEAGRFADAIQAVERALALASRQSNQQFVTALSARLALYRANTPVRE